jgi:argininosuccinate synthase
VSGTAVLAFSGGLDTSCAIAWLREGYGFDDVVAVLVDVGQEVEIEPAVARGVAAGAADVIVADRREEFADCQVAKALKANALYEGKYPLVSALSRPVIAEAVASVALEIGAEAVVHGCTGKGNDQLRFEIALRAKHPGVRVIAPLRDRVWAREEEIDYALARGIPVAQTRSSSPRTPRRRPRRRSSSCRSPTAFPSRSTASSWGWPTSWPSSTSARAPTASGGST